MDLQQIWNSSEPYVTALAIIIIGYFVAKLIAGAVAKGLGKTNLDDKLAKLTGNSGGGAMEKGIGKFVFYVLMLMVLLLGLDRAGIGAEVTAPLRNLVDDIIGAIPNILMAAIILAIAIAIATIVRKILENVLGAARLDERLGSGPGRPITSSVATAIYFFIILLSLPPALSALKMPSISEPIAGLVNDIMGYIPNVLAGIILFAIGFLIARIVQKILLNILTAVGFDSLPAKIGFKGEVGEGTRSPASIVSYVTMGLILVIVATQSVRIMELGVISELAEDFLGGFFSILGGVLILAAGVFVANLVSGLLVDKNTTLAAAARIAIIVFASAMALQRANIAPEISSTAFQVTLYAIGVAVGIGGAIALGLGGKDTVRHLLEKRFKP